MTTNKKIYQRGFFRVKHDVQNKEKIKKNAGFILQCVATACKTRKKIEKKREIFSVARCKENYQQKTAKEIFSSGEKSTKTTYTKEIFSREKKINKKYESKYRSQESPNSVAVTLPVLKVCGASESGRGFGGAKP
jgi:hypothetical protein